MKGQKSVFSDVPIREPDFVTIQDFLNTVWVRNQLESKSFAAFWALLEQEWAEQFKRDWAYGSGFEMVCDCGSSTCDECNPGWDLVDEPKPVRVEKPLEPGQKRLFAVAGPEILEPEGGFFQ